MSRNIIEIPKEIFENIFFQEGGTKEEKLVNTLAGGVQYGMDKDKPIAEANAELEKGEWILDSDGLRVVIGDTHKDGGEAMVLEDGAQVLSNYLEAPKSLINSLNKEYKTNIKPKSTYANALSQVYKKIGLNKLQEEQKVLIEKVKFQQDNTKDANTQMMNIQILSEKIKEIEDKKQSLEIKAEEVFSKLFEKQEASKPKDKVETNEEGKAFAQDGLWFQNGSWFPQQNQTYDQWNPQQNTTPQPININTQTVNNDNHSVVNRGVTPPPAAQIESPVNIAPASWQVLNQYALSDYGYQPFQPDGVAGTEVDKNLATQEIRRIFPSISSKYFDEGVNIPKDVLGFQSDIRNYYSQTLDSAKKLYGEDSEKYKQILTFINQNNFVNDKGNVRYTDNIYGNFTSTRPNIALELIPEEEYKKLQAEGINTVGQLKSKYPELYNQYVSQYDAPDDLWLAPIEETILDEVVIEVDRKEAPGKKETTEKKKQIEQDRVGIFNAPNQTPMLPSAMEAHLKTNRRYERADYTAMSPEQQLQEAARNQVRTEQNIDLLPASMRAGVLANLGANITEIANKAISQVQNVNNQAFQNVQNYNRQVQGREQDANAQDALNFEQRQLLAKAKTDNDIANWFNTIQRNQVGQFREINRANLMNTLYNDFQLTDRGIEATPQRRDILSSIRNTPTFQLTPEQTIEALRAQYGEEYIKELAEQAKKK